MEHTLAFLHTSPAHIPTFRTLLADLAPEIPARHVVDESLLSEACSAGEVTPALRERIKGTLLALEELGLETTVPLVDAIQKTIHWVRQGNFTFV